MAAFVAAAAITAGAGAYASRQAGKAAGAAQRGYDAATAEQARQFDLAREDTAPWRDVGRSALNQLASLYGLQQSGEIDPETGTAAQVGAPDYSAFYDSPDYQFARDEGLRGIERSAAARGGLASGNTLAALTRFSSGLATQNFGNYTNRLAGLAGTGQQSAENLGAMRMQYGQQVGQNAVGAANARSSGIANQANIWGGVGNQLAGMAGYYANQRKQPLPYGGTGAGGGMIPQGGVMYG
jgi:hypothetical protein